MTNEQLALVAHYLRYGSGQSQGTRFRPTDGSPSLPTERYAALFIIEGELLARGLKRVVRDDLTEVWT